MLSPLRDHSKEQMAEEASSAMAEAAERRRGEAGGEQRKRKKTLGRQKIEIKRIERVAARHVCFSKRRSGLFKKAAELAALCGAHVAVVVFSGAEKPYSLGHPSVDAVLDRYLDPASAAAAAGAAPSGPAVDPAVLEEFESEKERLDKAIAAEARRREALDAAARAAGVPDSDDVHRSGMPDLLATLAALECVRAEAMQRMHEAIVEEMTIQHCAAAVSADASGAFYCPAGPGAFAADGGARSSHQGVIMDTQMLMGGVANHASMPSAPMTMPPYLPPPPPFNYGSHHNQLAGYGYDDIGDGSCHDAAATPAAAAYHGTTTTCNFFW